MSTKSIRKALQAMADTQDVGLGGLALEALADVEAIEKAAREWVEDKPSISSHEVLERIAEESTK